MPFSWTEVFQKLVVCEHPDYIHTDSYFCDSCKKATKNTKEHKEHEVIVFVFFVPPLCSLWFNQIRKWGASQINEISAWIRKNI